MHILSVRELIKDRETVKADKQTQAVQDSIIQAQAERLRIADSTKAEQRAQLRYWSKIDTIQAEKETLYKVRVSALEAENKRLRRAPWVAAIGSAIFTGLIFIIAK